MHKIAISKDPNKNWKNNDIQFARLLSELKTTGLTPRQYHIIEDSTGLNTHQINEILDRADHQWEIIRQETNAKSHQSCAVILKELRENRQDNLEEHNK